MSRRRTVLGHDAKIAAFALLAGLPGVVVSMVFVWRGDLPLKAQLTLTLLVVAVWLGFTATIRDQVVRPLQTIANLLAAVREGAFSVRGRAVGASPVLRTVMDEINTVGETLREQRLGAIEAHTLLNKVMLEIDVAIFAFDKDQMLRLVNRAGELLLGRPPGRLLGQGADTLGMAALLQGEPARRVEATFAGGRGPWELRRTAFRQHGVPHELVVLTDVQRALREEERQAWQRLVRVLGHEINNSLTPISSITGNLRQLVARPERPGDWEADLARGLEIVERRAEALGRFMSAYARLAKLPPPRVAPLDVETWIRRVVALDARLPVTVAPGPALSIAGDGDQLDQLLINLVRNAIDAAQETGGGVRVSWSIGKQVEVIVADDGPGIAEASNLFVPFFTTKPGGSGIGLVLSRQIAEAHGGSLDLRNRREPCGCDAVLRLPL